MSGLQGHRLSLLRLVVPNVIAVLFGLMLTQLPFFRWEKPDSFSVQIASIFLGAMILIVRELGEKTIEYYITRHKALPNIKHGLELLLLRIRAEERVQWQSDEQLIRSFIDAYGERAIAFNELSSFADFLRDHHDDANIVTFAGFNEAKLKLFERSVETALEELNNA